MDIKGLLNSNIYQTGTWREIRRVAEIVRAPLFKDEGDTSGTMFSIISIKDFPLAGYLPEPAKKVRLVASAERAERFLAQPHDCLVTIVGTIGRVALVPEDATGKWIPATNMLRIRFHERRKEQAVALYAFFKSPVGTATLSSLVHGTSIPLVAKGPFSSIRIPDLNDGIVEESFNLWRREESLFRDGQAKIDESQRVFEGFLN